jgi:hypothetical protein
MVNNKRGEEMSTSVIEGQVKFVKQNNGGYYAVLMSDEQWYGYTKEKPPFDKGDNIRFEVVTNGRFLNVAPDTVEIIAGGPAPARSAPPARRAGGAQKFSTAGKDEYWKAKEARDIVHYAKRDARDIMVQNEIRLQASRNAAIELMGIALANKIVEFGEPKKKGANLEVLATYVDKLTQKYYDATKAINPVVVEAPAVAEVDEVEEVTAGGDFPDALNF